MRLRLGLSAAALLVATSASADTYTFLGTNAESVALGGAMTAGPIGGSSAHYNPAALNKARKQDTELTYVWLKPALYIDRKKNEGLDAYLAKNKPGPNDSEYVDYNVIRFRSRVNDIQEKRAEDVPLIRGFNIGIVMPLAEVREESRAALGFSVYVPQGPILRQRINAPDTPYFVEFDDRTQRIVIDAGVGIDITDRVHIGGGTSLLVDVPVDVDIYVPVNIDLVDVATRSGGIDVGVTPLAEIKIPPVIAPIAGVLWETTDWLSFGATYRGEVKSEVDATANILAETGTGRTTKLPVSLHSSAAFTPRQVALGTKFKPTDDLTVYADATWSEWSQYRPPLAEFTVSNIRQLVREIIAGTGLKDLPILGNKITIGEDIEVLVPTEDEIIDFVPDYVRVRYEVRGFRNTWTPRLGIGYQLDEEISMMGGYSYRPSVIGPNGIRVTQVVDLGGTVTRTNLNENTLDNDTHTLTLGALYKYKQFKVGATGVYAKLIEREVDKTLNERLSFRDESSRLGVQTTAFGYPGYTYGGAVFGAMVQAGVAF